MLADNIVQAEFFHVGKDHPSLAALMADCDGRVVDGMPIKTVVRFSDSTGTLTSLIQESVRLEADRKNLDWYFPATRGLYRWWLDKKSRWLAGKHILLRERAVKIVAKRLGACEVANIQIEVVKGDKRTFRPLYSDEHHELLEVSRKASGVWIFLFDRREHMLGVLM